MTDDNNDEPSNVIEGPWSQPIPGEFPDGCINEHSPAANPRCDHVPRAERQAGGPMTMVGGSSPATDLDAPVVFRGSTTVDGRNAFVLVSVWRTHAEVAFRPFGSTSWGPPVRCDRVPH